MTVRLQPPRSVLQVLVLRQNTPDDIVARMQEMKPSIIYMHGSVSGERAGLERQSIGKLGLLHNSGALLERLLQTLVGIKPELIYLDAQDCMTFGKYNMKL